MSIIGEYLSLDVFKSIVFSVDPVTISPEVRKRIERSYDFLQSFASNKIIYGVNTGFGPMAQYRIEEEDVHQLQYNLIRSHSSGMGTPLSPLYVKAAVLARLNTLGLGYSGVHISLIELMLSLINHGITPLMYNHGGVGASGDLVQLAHLALVLIGEGEVIYREERMPAKIVFEQLGLEPAAIHLREGISLMNGTSVMTGIGVINVHYAERLLQWSIKISAMINEIVAAYDDHFSQELNASKLHKGQLKVALAMSGFLSGSRLIRKREDHLYHKENKEQVFKEKIQEYYSLRCVPQILGPVWDTIQYTAAILEQELNSASDNPIVDPDAQQVYHGGNFHGDYVALEMDKLKTVVTKLTILAERQLNFLLNARLNGVLPPFVNLGKLGFNFGMQGAQFTATSTTAESQTLSNPMYIHSIPNNNDNQDIVSMGVNAALITEKVIENAFDVLSIELVTLIQAIDALEYRGKICASARDIYDQVRSIIPSVTEDIPLYPYLQQVKDYLKNGE